MDGMTLFILITTLISFVIMLVQPKIAEMRYVTLILAVGSMIVTLKDAAITGDNQLIMMILEFAVLGFTVAKIITGGKR